MQPHHPIRFCMAENQPSMLLSFHLVPGPMPLTTMLGCRLDLAELAESRGYDLHFPTDGARLRGLSQTPLQVRTCSVCSIQRPRLSASW